MMNRPVGFALKVMNLERMTGMQFEATRKAESAKASDEELVQALVEDMKSWREHIEQTTVACQQLLESFFVNEVPSEAPSDG